MLCTVHASFAGYKFSPTASHHIPVHKAIPADLVSCDLYTVAIEHDDDEYAFSLAINNRAHDQVSPV